MAIGRLLIMRGGAVGDFIVTLPVIDALRRAFPQAWIEILGHPSRACLARHPRYADRVTDLERLDVYRLFQSQTTVSAALSDYLHAFDLILAYWPSAGGVLTNQLRRFTSGEVMTWPPHPPVGMHVTDHLLQALASLPFEDVPLENVNMQPRVEVSEEGERGAEDFWRRSGLAERGVVAFHPGSGSRDKLWPLEGWGEVIRGMGQRGMSGVIIQGPVEQERDLALLRSREMPGWPWAKDLSLPELASVLRRCQVVVSHDSGIAHLAAAVGTATLALFGPTNPRVWGPRSVRACVLQPATAQPLTLDNLPPIVVAETIKQLLNGTFAWAPSSASYTIVQV